MPGRHIGGRGEHSVPRQRGVLPQRDPRAGGGVGEPRRALLHVRGHGHLPVSLVPLLRTAARIRSAQRPQTHEGERPDTVISPSAWCHCSGLPLEYEVLSDHKHMKVSARTRSSPRRCHCSGLPLEYEVLSDHKHMKVSARTRSSPRRCHCSGLPLEYEVLSDHKHTKVSARTRSSPRRCHCSGLPLEYEVLSDHKHTKVSARTRSSPRRCHCSGLPLEYEVLSDHKHMKVSARTRSSPRQPRATAPGCRSNTKCSATTNT